MSVAPLVSVVVPTYNARQLLLETLDSVFAQTLTDYEVIVVNDGSTDDTGDRLAPLVSAGKIRIINQANGGVGSARNRGLSEATGKYVAFLDHDDLWHPEKLERQVEFLESRPGFVGCGCVFSISNHPMEPAVVACHDLCNPVAALASGNLCFVTASTQMFVRERVNDLRFGSQRGATEDVEFYLQCLPHGRYGIVGPDILASYRVHEGSASRSAQYHREGVRRLRSLDRAGAFSDLRILSGAPLDAYLAHLARTAIMHQVLAGQRWQALRLYAEEFKPQFRLRRFKFLLGTPMVTLLPRVLVSSYQSWGRAAPLQKQ
jgi:glycosyltransferase involved in cell wall biosynthesis